jgi:hypothetical protein
MDKNNGSSYLFSPWRFVNNSRFYLKERNCADVNQLSKIERERERGRERERERMRERERERERGRNKEREK